MSTTHEPEWSIQQIARLASTTSRTLRHYDDVGLVAPSRIGDNGYRYYDAAALVRLQRVLLLRELGLGIPAITELFDGQRDDVAALESHRRWLVAEQERLARQLASVTDTITRIKNGEQIMAETMFDGFDHTQYREEVEQRWGAEAYERSDAWLRGMSPRDRSAFGEVSKTLIADWRTAASGGIAPDSDEAQALAQRQFHWLSGIPGTPQTADGRPTKAYFVGLGEMYVADPRFAKNYGGADGAAFVRDAVRIYADRELT
ncbi:MAG: MerR family transcriptional regulator [Pseudolysinimonas sp.]